MSRGKIPDRWIPYEACGDVIEGTRLICFKVPLHKNVQHRVPGITKIWDIPAVLEEIPKLGAVIDLTNTARYYNPRDFEAANVSHRKILMPGREIPPETKVREFMNAVDEFLGKDSDSLVGVHCTHGLNRTGYMVCRYMRDRLNISAEDTILRFEKARGYRIERDNYKAAILDKKPPPPDLDEKSQPNGKRERNTTVEDHVQRSDNSQSINVSDCRSRDNNESKVTYKRHSNQSTHKRPRSKYDGHGRYMPYNRTNDEREAHNEKNRDQWRNRSGPKQKKRKVYHS